MCMSSQMDIKREVREFYDQVGWQEVGEGLYQNARFEDLRPVSRDYIHRCHMRVLRHLETQGYYLLDAGSGPIQYPEYLDYSRGYSYRVCADISIVALIEARKRIGAHGFFVVADIANLPFKPGCFEGIVSLHAIHHLPLDEHAQAYTELYRLLAPGSSAVVVNGWDSAPLVVLVNGLIRVAEWVYALKARLIGSPVMSNPSSATENQQSTISDPQPTGTFVRMHNAAWLKKEIGSRMPVEIWTWRSVSVRFLRTLIHERWGGRILLRGLFWLEERFPHFCGKNGQYPLVVVRKLL